MSTLCHALCSQKEIRIAPQPQVAPGIGGQGRVRKETGGDTGTSGLKEPGDRVAVLVA